MRYAPLHNWTAYEEALKTNPVLAKMVISGVVYSVGDWIAQVSFLLAEDFSKKIKTILLMFFKVCTDIYGSVLLFLISAMKANHFLSLIVHACSDQALSALHFTDHYLIITINSVRYSSAGKILKLALQIHYCYSTMICETTFVTSQALFPFEDWWVVPAKVAFDQTIWAAIWNSIYYVVLGLLRFESPISIFRELKATFWPMLTVRKSTLVLLLWLLLSSLNFSFSIYRLVEVVINKQMLKFNVFNIYWFNKRLYETCDCSMGFLFILIYLLFGTNFRQGGNFGHLLTLLHTV